jgi:hypothetical protein
MLLQLNGNTHNMHEPSAEIGFNETAYRQLVSKDRRFRSRDIADDAPVA